MVRYKITSGFECGFVDNCYISEMPMGTGLACVKGLSRAKKFYKQDMEKVEKAIIKRGCTFELEGEVENRPRDSKEGSE